MNIIDAVIQGILQGITEFLPISSSGHLSISKHFFGISLPTILFDIMLHLGTLIAVVVMYRKTVARVITEIFKLISDAFRGRFKWGEMDADRRLLMMLIIGLVPLFLLFLPILGTDMAVKDFSEKLATDNSVVAEGAALLFTSFLLFKGIRMNKKMRIEKIVTNKKGQLVESNGRKKIHSIDAVVIGLMQLLAAVFPGISRSGSTLSVGMMRGLNKQTALDYSFVLGIPAILAAAVVSVKDASPSDVEAVGAAALIVGIVVSCIVGFLAIKLLRWIISADRLQVFAYYTLIVGGVVLILGIIETITGVPLFN